MSKSTITEVFETLEVALRGLGATDGFVETQLVNRRRLHKLEQTLTELREWFDENGSMLDDEFQLILKGQP